MFSPHNHVIAGTLLKLCSATRPNLLLLWVNFCFVDKLNGKCSVHENEIEDIATCFGTSLNTEDPTKSGGLSSQQVKYNAIKYGSNASVQTCPLSLWIVVCIHAFDIYVLLLALTGLCLMRLHTKHNPDNNHSHTLYIGMLLLVGAAVTYVESCVQSARSAAALEQSWLHLQLLRKRESYSCTVTRDGRQTRLNFEEVVCGDLLHLSGGDIVPCDVAVVWQQQQEEGGGGLVVQPCWSFRLQRAGGPAQEGENVKGEGTVLLRKAEVLSGCCLAIALPGGCCSCTCEFSGAVTAPARRPRCYWLQQRLAADTLWLLVFAVAQAAVVCLVATALGRQLWCLEFLEGLIGM
jgi:P-type Mg2+ transporter